MFVGRVFVSVLAGCLAANSTSGFSVMEAAATSTQLCQPSAVAFLLQGLWRPPPQPRHACSCGVRQGSAWSYTHIYRPHGSFPGGGFTHHFSLCQLCSQAKRRIPASHLLQLRPSRAVSIQVCTFFTCSPISSVFLIFYGTRNDYLRESYSDTSYSAVYKVKLPHTFYISLKF